MPYHCPILTTYHLSSTWEAILSGLQGANYPLVLPIIIIMVQNKNSTPHLSPPSIGSYMAMVSNSIWINNSQLLDR